MIEEIKKEIKNTFYIDEYNMHFEVAEININTLFKILDKYKDQDKYKNAWEELKVIINEDIKTCEEEKVKHPLSKNEWEFAKMTDEEIIKNIENLEEKYKIKRGFEIDPRITED